MCILYIRYVFPQTLRQTNTSGSTSQLYLFRSVRSPASSHARGHRHGHTWAPKHWERRNVRRPASGRLGNRMPQRHQSRSSSSHRSSVYTCIIKWSQISRAQASLGWKEKGVGADSERYSEHTMKINAICWREVRVRTSLSVYTLLSVRCACWRRRDSTVVSYFGVRMSRFLSRLRSTHSTTSGSTAMHLAVRERVFLYTV